MWAWHVRPAVWPLAASKVHSFLEKIDTRNVLLLTALDPKTLAFMKAKFGNICRKPGEVGYKIPYGGMFAYLSAPNYSGKSIFTLR